MLIIKSLRLLNGISAPSIFSRIFSTKSSIGGLLAGFCVRKGRQMAFYVSAPMIKRIGSLKIFCVKSPCSARIDDAQVASSPRRK